MQIIYLTGVKGTCDLRALTQLSRKIKKIYVTNNSITKQQKLNDSH